jgi:FkbM family methyltransferase
MTQETSTARAIYRRARRLLRRAAGRDIQFPVQIDVPTARHGSEGAWWEICPRGIGPGSVVYCVGIGTDISFDLALIETYGVTVHAFDPTPGSIAWLKAQRLPSQYRWREVGLAAHDGRATFFPPENRSYVSHTMVPGVGDDDRAIEVEVRRVSTLMRDLGHGRIDVLKMDIEGAEYDVLDDMLATGVMPRQLLVEFHHRFPGVGIEPTRRTVERLNAAGYRIFSTAPSGEEYGFILPN